MARRKKYRQGREYLVMVAGKIFLPGREANYFSSTVCLVERDMNALEMRDWAFNYVREQHDLKDGTFCHSFYRVESM